MFVPEKLYKEICKVVPLAHADTVVMWQGKVLLMKRAIYPVKGHWCLPGGGIQLGETPKQAAIRELKEETGIVVGEDELTGEKIVTWFHRTRQDIVITYLLKGSTNGVELNEEHNAYGWYGLTDILPQLIDKQTIDQVNWAYKVGIGGESSKY